MAKPSSYKPVSSKEWLKTINNGNYLSTVIRKKGVKNNKAVINIRHVTGACLHE